MGLFGWFRKQTAPDDAELTAWRREWEAAVSGTPGDAEVVRLRGDLDRLSRPEEEIEIEREMLDGLQRLVDLHGSPDLPVVATGHRAVGAETCRLSAPASMPDEAAQPSGRLLLTGTRAIFVGGASGSTVPWHALGEIVRADRDLVLVRKDRSRLYRFRFNTFGDAVEAAYLARRLAGRPPAPGAL
jgi:hypothetical protein